MSTFSTFNSLISIYGFIWSQALWFSFSFNDRFEFHLSLNWPECKSSQQTNKNYKWVNNTSYTLTSDLMICRLHLIDLHENICIWFVKAVIVRVFGLSEWDNNCALGSFDSDEFQKALKTGWRWNMVKNQNNWKNNV